MYISIQALVITIPLVLLIYRTMGNFQIILFMKLVKTIEDIFQNDRVIMRAS